MCCLFTEDRRNRVLYTLSILVAIIETLLDCSGYNVLPEPLELCIL